MADNIFDRGGTFSGQGLTSRLSPLLSESLRVDSPDRDNIMKSITRLSDTDLEMLYDLANLVSETGDVRPIIQRLQQLDERPEYRNLNGPLLSSVFKFDPNNFQLTVANNNLDYLRLLQFHVGARRRARTAQRTIGDHQTRVTEGLRNRDVVYVTNSRPCAKFDMSKSPYERFRQIWENSKGDLTRVQNVDLSFLPDGTRQRALDYLIGSIRPVGGPIPVTLWESGIFDREPLQDGATVPMDLGTQFGRAVEDDEYRNANTFEERKKLAYDRLTPLFMPRLVEDVLQNATDNDFNPIDKENDLTDNPDKIKKLDPEYQALITQYMLNVSLKDVQDFIDQYKDFVKMTGSEQVEFVNKGGFFGSEAKKNTIIGFLSVLTLLETSKVPFDLMSDVIKLPHFATSHSAAIAQGVLELILGAYKSMYYFSHGKPGAGLKQAGITLISAMCEFGWPAFAQSATSAVFGQNLLGRLVASGLGGYVGLSITAAQTVWEFGIKPKYAYREFALKNELLDLERQMIEDECCQNINAELYRKTGGALLVLMTEDDAIPVGREYRRTVQGAGESLNAIRGENTTGTQIAQPSPCESNGEVHTTIEQRFIKFQSAYDPNDLSNLPDNPASGPIYLVDPRKDPDPCATARERKKRREEQRNKILGRSEEEGGDIGLLQYIPDTSTGNIPMWSESQEQQLQLASEQYNRQYISDVYNFKIDSAKCRTGEIQSYTGGPGGGIYDRDQFYPLETGGDPNGLYRTGFTFIEIPGSQQTTTQTPDPIIWGLVVDLYGVGGGGQGDNVRLRGPNHFGNTRPILRRQV